MSTRKRLRVAGVIGAFAVLLTLTAVAQQRFGFGTTPSESEIQSLDIAVGPNGEGLPAGKGSVQEGEKVFAGKCAVCHGPNGAGGPYDQLVGGTKPVKTIGSFWPYATTVFDYSRRAMPFNKPGSLTNDEVYAVTAWLLWKNNIIPEDSVMDATTLPKVKMPNRNGFVPDPRPDVKTETRGQKTP